MSDSTPTSCNNWTFDLKISRVFQRRYFVWRVWEHVNYTFRREGGSNCSWIFHPKAIAHIQVDETGAPVKVCFHWHSFSLVSAHLWDWFQRMRVASAMLHVARLSAALRRRDLVICSLWLAFMSADSFLLSNNTNTSRVRNMYWFAFSYPDMIHDFVLNFEQSNDL